MKRWVVFWLVLAPVLASADSFRCGRYLVSAGDSQAQVLDRCGGPQRSWQDGFIEEVVRRADHSATLSNLGGSSPVVSQPAYETEYRRVIPVYRWEYALGRGSFLKILTFHSDTLVSIENGPRQ
ncbi:MAG: DUF2845 domain-containing protein [Candidatus Contendobacter sp.]